MPDARPTIHIPTNAVVILIGAAGAGKSTFASRHFPAEVIVSSDSLRRLVAGDASSQRANDEVFGRIHQTLEARATAGLLTVIDATNTGGPGRSELAWHAHRHRRPLVAMVLDLPLEACLAQNARRSHPVPARVIRQQVADLRHLETDLEIEGYVAVHIFRSGADLEAAHIGIGDEMP